jgi:glycosyltransferase involved in cell wall biosynthesis
VETILAQDRPCDELIVINDAPADIPDDIGAKCAARGIAFRSLRSSPPSLPASRNVGMAAASGDIIVLLDDDMDLPRNYLRLLENLYSADSEQRIGGIAANVVERAKPSLPRRVWATLAVAFASNRWAPWRSAARYLTLPATLRGRLRPARAMQGPSISVRRRVARVFRFNAAFSGYAMGEDVEFSFRVEPHEPIFVASDLMLWHEPAPTRPNLRERGRMYVCNMLWIAHNCVGGGAGTYLLLGYNFAGLALMALAYAAIGRRRDNFDFAAGIFQELVAQALAPVRRTLRGR